MSRFATTDLCCYLEALPGGHRGDKTAPLDDVRRSNVLCTGGPSHQTRSLNDQSWSIIAGLVTVQAKAKVKQTCTILYAGEALPWT